MSRTRSLAATLALACLAAPLVTATPTAASPTTTAARAAAPVVRVTTSYGARAIKVPEGSRTFLRFAGRKGDVVTVDHGGRAPARLFRQGRAVRPTWVGGDLYRLPRDGRFTFRVAADNFGDQKVRLVKARVHALAVDGRALRTKKARRGYIDVVAVRLRSGDRVTVDTGRTEQRLYSPDGTFEVGYGHDLMLRPGHDMRVLDDASAVGGTVVRGTNLVRVRSGHRVTAASALEVPVTPDGDAVVVSAERRAARELVFTFEADSGDLVYFDEIDGPSVSAGRSMVDRWDGGATGLVSEPAGARSFVVPTSGSHELSTVTDEIGGATSAVARLRKGVRMRDLVPDGPAVDFTLDGSGTRVYALATDSGQRLEATARDLAPDERWTITMGPRYPWSCGQEPGGPMGCADNFTASVSDAKPIANDPYLYVRQPVAVAYPAPGATGTVSLRLLSRAVS